MAEREHFRCLVHERPDATILELHGELDLDTVEQVQEIVAAAAAAKRGMTLDLRGLRFIDSSGLNLIVQTAALARADGFGFAIIPSPEPIVQRLFADTGAERYIPFIEADDERAGD